MVEYYILRVVWWALIGILLMGFIITDGWDFGIASIRSLIAKNENEKRIILRVMEPFWEGNQVWIILGAGAIFAAWPFVYAVAFSSFYLLMLLLLLTMGIARSVSFKYRNKVNQANWYDLWDTIIFIGGFFPPIIFGILVGNVIQGLPFHLDNNLRIFYTGGFWSLFNPFALLCGLLSLAMVVMHGSIYLAIKTLSPIRDRALFYSQTSAVAVVVLFVICTFFITYVVPGYVLLGQIDPNGPSNPLNKQTALQMGAWWHNYHAYPIAALVPIAGTIGALGVLLFARVGSGLLAFLFSSLAIIGIIGTVGVGMFPFILPSKSHYASSLLVWDASSSALTLGMMLLATIVFLPIILIYTSWVFYVLRGKVTENQI